MLMLMLVTITCPSFNHCSSALRLDTSMALLVVACEKQSISPGVSRIEGVASGMTLSNDRAEAYAVAHNRLGKHRSLWPILVLYIQELSPKDSRKERGIP